MSQEANKGQGDSSAGDVLAALPDSLLLIPGIHMAEEEN